MEFLTLFNMILSFIMVLYAEPSFPRKIVDIVIEFLVEFISKQFCLSLEKSILDIIEKAENKHEAKIKIKDAFNMHCKIFQNFTSEKKNLSFLKSKGYREPEQFEVRKTFSEIIKDNNFVFVQTPVYAYYVPLPHSLTYFFRIPGLARQVIDHVKMLSSENDIISNVIQGKFWRNNFSVNPVLNEYILPLFVYYDDIEVGNALGSHGGQNKFGVTYASVACLPEHLASILESIIFSMIIRSEDFKQCDNISVFRVLISELNFLRTTGIKILVDNVLVVFKFQTVLILGDNLGLNSICGFVESFKANVYCRICFADSFECQLFCSESKEHLRTIENYQQDLLKKDSHRTGIKEECAFNQIHNFHVVTNKSIDFMHDILEGVCVYVIRAILYEYIFVLKLFTLQYLNLKIQEFNLYSDDSNKPPPITVNRLKAKLNLKYSAAEMLFLVKYLGILIGDKVPRDNEHWHMYITLKKIVDILMSPRYVITHLKDLNSLINELNASYLRFYKALKPKFHFLIHYVWIMYLFGPCVHYWTMRYESKHRELKANALTSSSKVNLLKTICIKQSLKMCKTFDTLDKKSEISFQSNNAKDELYYSSVNIKGCNYNIGSFVVVSLDNPDTIFGKILEIKKRIHSERIHGKETPIISVDFKLDIYEELYFDDHYMAYIVKNSFVKKVFNHRDMPSMPTVFSIEKGNLHYIIPRYVL